MVEEIEQELLKLYRLLYHVTKIKYLSENTSKEFEKYNKKFIDIRGNYYELFKEYEDDFEDSEINILSDDEFIENYIKEKGDTKELLVLINTLSDISMKLITLSDLKQEQEEIIKSLKYIILVQDVEIHNKILNNLFKEENTQEIKEYLTNLQEIILSDFKNKVTNPQEFKNGDYFRFLCYSVKFTKYDKNRQKKFVSTSLLTPKHTKTYRLEYGFIMPPGNIICASSNDQFTDITAQSKEQTFETIIPRIDAIEKIDEETKEYSEILIEDFKPIAIFCLTDGSKTLNLNYYNAQKLKENFPDLDIIDIDLTYYKEDLTEIRNKLVNHINAKLGIFEEVDYDLYDSFFMNYLALKKKQELTEEDILKLFKEYAPKTSNIKPHKI